MIKTKKKNLALEIGDLITAKTNIVSDDENEESRAKVVDFSDQEHSDDELRDSNLRKKNVLLLDKLDKRYAGKKISRNDAFKSEFNNDSDSEKTDSNSDVQDDENNYSDEEDNITDNSADSAGSENDSDNSSELSDDSILDEEDESSFNETNSKDAEKDDLEDSEKLLNMSKQNINEEIEKGNSIRNQIKLWEKLLDVRIKFQKCLLTSNKLPQQDTFKQLNSDENFRQEAKQTQQNLRCLLDKLLELNNVLFVKNKCSETDKSDEEILSDSEEETRSDENVDKTVQDYQSPQKKARLSLPSYERLISREYNSYIPQRNSEIKKWNDKTRIASIVSNKKSNHSIMQQIEFTLKDKPKLIKRTQLKRSDYEIVGKLQVENEDGRRVEEYDSEIYDDDDFYHELLREFIHQKTSDITDPTLLSKQWVQLQSMRSKLKRKIDTRATKGRRLRYNVHQKLVNYMAPVLVNDTMTDEAKNELYNSLFGQVKASNHQANGLTEAQ